MHWTETRGRGSSSDPPIHGRRDPPSKPNTQKAGKLQRGRQRGITLGATVPIDRAGASGASGSAVVLVPGLPGSCLGSTLC
jgi:hypothetical protein